MLMPLSEDRSIVGTISTSGARTSSGNEGSGKILKLRSDVLSLTMVDAKRRVVIITEQDMCNRCERGVAAFLQRSNSSAL